MDAWWFLYNAVLSVSWPLLWLYYRIRKETSGKYGTSYRFRLGLEFPHVFQWASSPLWVHALSVGEVLSAIPLVERIRRSRPDVAVVFSVATEKGFRVARKELEHLATAVFYMPHDHLWTTVRLVRRINPAVFVLVETDLWPNLLRTLKKQNVPVFLVNARLSSRSFGRYRRLGKIGLGVLDHLERIYTQSEEDARRFAMLGVARDRLSVAGNLKYDLAVYQKDRSARTLSGYAEFFGQRRLIWVAGSTHEGEETTMVLAHQRVLQDHPDALLVLAPRHIERAPRLAALCERHGLRWRSRSAHHPLGDAQVFLLDTIGELAMFYPLAKGAFVGGSLVPRGGHNPLEAAVHGVPCCWGPFLDNFREIESFLVEHGCGRCVQSVEDLSGFVLESMDDGLWDGRRRSACAQRVCSRAGTAGVIARDLIARWPVARALTCDRPYAKKHAQFFKE